MDCPMKKVRYDDENREFTFDCRSPRGASPANSVVPFGSMVERRRSLDQRGGARLRLHQQW
jgi:hypothetical protein